MRLSSLCIAAIFLFSSVAFSQHGGGGSSGGSSGGGSSSSGGGSHSSGGGGGSSSSGGGHSSGGSGSHGSSSHGSSGSASRGSGGSGSASKGATPSASGAGVTSPRSVADMLRSGNIRVVDMRVVNEKNETVVFDRKTTQQVVEMVKAGRSEEQISDFIRARANSTPVSAKIEIHEHKGFLGVLRHPFRKSEPVREVKIVGQRRHPPFCKGSHCPVCPAGRAGCGYLYHERSACSSRELWNGGFCLLQTQFLDNCSGLRMALQRQQQRMAAAESIRKSACAAGSPDCTSATTAWQSEENLHRTLSVRYMQCQRQSTGAMGGSGFRGYGLRTSFDPLRAESNY